MENVARAYNVDPTEFFFFFFNKVAKAHNIDSTDMESNPNTSIKRKSYINS